MHSRSTIITWFIGDSFLLKIGSSTIATPGSQAYAYLTISKLNPWTHLLIHWNLFLYFHQITAVIVNPDSIENASAPQGEICAAGWSMVDMAPHPQVWPSKTPHSAGNDGSVMSWQQSVCEDSGSLDVRCLISTPHRNRLGMCCCMCRQRMERLSSHRLTSIPGHLLVAGRQSWQSLAHSTLPS